MDNKDNSNHSFCAMLARMKYINRWGLMRCSRAETLSEHVAETAILAHILALLAREMFKQEKVSPEKIAVAALYHDASEIITGDMPTPVKYKNEDIKRAYKALERESSESLAKLLPEELRPAIKPFLTGEALNGEENKILKAADRISALIKCIEEENSGNKEFKSARDQQLKLLEEMDCPAADYFMEHFLPCYHKNLDELTGNC